MLTDVEVGMMKTILRGHGSAIDAKMILLENQTLIESNPLVAALLDDVLECFLDLSLRISPDSSTSTHHLNNNSVSNYDDNDNMLLGRSSTKGKEVVIVIKHDSHNSPDRLSWKNYGRKHIKNCTQFRYYYKCTYGNCNAKKWVQKFEENLSMSTTTYRGLHTCEAAVPVNADVSSSNMIQFGSQTITNSFVPSLPQIVHQQTVAVDTGMNQVCDNQFWGSQFSFLPYGDPMSSFDNDFNKNF